jgi:hypothetical protein
MSYEIEVSKIKPTEEEIKKKIKAQKIQSLMTVPLNHT